MALADLKFQSSDFTDQDIASLPNQVVGQATTLKARFDNIGKNLLALGKFNDLIDEIQLMVPCGRRFTNIDTQSVANDTATYIDCRNPLYDYGTNYPTRTTANEFKINFGGIYIFEATLAFTAGTTGTRRAWIYHTRGGTNTTLAEDRLAPAPSGGTSISLTAIYDCLADDIIKIGAYHTQGAALDITQAYTHISLSKIG